jgi:hypothetical protein
LVTILTKETSSTYFTNLWSNMYLFALVAPHNMLPMALLVHLRVH